MPDPILPSTPPAAMKWWTLAVVGSGTFMSALDTSVINIALPSIGRQTGASISTLEWVALAYLITVSATLLAFGRLGDLQGRRRIYMLGQALFGLGSLFCALSGGIGLLIASRVVQGLGASMLFALSPAILVAVFPPEARGRALGMQATMTYLGMSIGPGLGGFLTQHFGWPAIFFVNVPIAFIMLAVSYRVLRTDARRQAQPFDLRGSLAMMVALALLLFVLSKGLDLGWTSLPVLAAATVALLAFLLFLRTETRVAHPALDLHLFRSPAFSFSTLAAFLCYVTTAGTNFMLPFFLIQGCARTTGQAGLVMMMIPAGMLALTGLSGLLSDRIGPRLPTVLGMLLMAAGFLLVRTLTPATPLHPTLAFALLIGLGAGLFTAPNNSAIMGAAPGARQGVAGAVLAAARTIGFASGVALGGLSLTLAMHRQARRPAAAAVQAGLRQGLLALSGLAVLAALLCLIRRRTPRARPAQAPRPEPA